MKKIERLQRQLEIAVQALRDIADSHPRTLYAILGGTVKSCCQSYDVAADEALSAMGELGPLPGKDDGRKAKTKEGTQGQRGQGEVA
jgi:hypothetical protein